MSHTNFCVASEQEKAEMVKLTGGMQIPGLL